MQRNGWIQQMTDNNRQKDRSSNRDNGLEKSDVQCSMFVRSLFCCHW